MHFLTNFSANFSASNVFSVGLARQASSGSVDLCSFCAALSQGHL